MTTKFRAYILVVIFSCLPFANYFLSANHFEMTLASLSDNRSLGIIPLPPFTTFKIFASVSLPPTAEMSGPTSPLKSSP